MTGSNQRFESFPSGFGSIVIKSASYFRRAFISYITLAILTYIPFLIIIQISAYDILDIIEFFHGHFLDIIVFLTLPTLLLERRVFPFATISMFFQRFFASAVLLSLIQFGTLILFMMFSIQISIGVILLGLIPYIFLLFSGFFLIMENSNKLFSIRYNLLNSIRLVKTQFFPVFWNYLNITIIMFVPLFAFSLWYFGSHPEITDIRKALESGTGNDMMLTQRFLETMQRIALEPGFRWSRIGIHILIRPLKSLFLSILFLGLLQRVSPHIVEAYFGRSEEEASPSTDDVEPNSDHNQE